MVDLVNLNKISQFDFYANLVDQKYKFDCINDFTWYKNIFKNYTCSETFSFKHGINLL